MAGKPSFPLYPGDVLRSTDLRMCSWATRGIWCECLWHMHSAEYRGRLEGTKEELCRLIGCTLDELDFLLEENDRHGFCVAEICEQNRNASVTRENQKVTLINRRMYREEAARRKGRERIERWRKGDSNATEPPSLPSSSSFSLSIDKHYAQFDEQVWKPYPRKIEKQRTFTVISERLNEGVTIDHLAAAARNYAAGTSHRKIYLIKSAYNFFGGDEPWREWVDGVPPGEGPDDETMAMFLPELNISTESEANQLLAAGKIAYDEETGKWQRV